MPSPAPLFPVLPGRHLSVSGRGPTGLILLKVQVIITVDAAGSWSQGGVPAGYIPCEEIIEWTEENVRSGAGRGMSGK